MGLREKALQFKWEKNIHDTPIDNTPGPAAGEAANLELASENPASANHTADHQGPYQENSAGQNQSEPFASTWEIIQQMIQAKEKETLFDLVLIAIWQHYKPQKIVLWAGESLSLRGYRGQFMGSCPKQLNLTLAQQKHTQKLGPVFQLHENPYLSQMDFLQTNKLSSFLTFSHDNETPVLIAMDQTIQESWPEVNAQISVINHALQQIGIPARESNETFADLTQKPICDINRQMQTFPHMTVVHLSIKNHPRILNLFGQEITSQVEEEYKSILMQILPLEAAIYKISSRDFLLTCPQHIVSECQTFLDQIKHKIQQIELSHDFRPVVVHRFFSANKDFTCAEQLLSFL